MSMEQEKNKIAKDLFGMSIKDAHSSEVCVVCGEDVGELTTAIYAAEYRISGMCPVCQDALFSGKEGEE